jgi:glycosyltransferase involved in cell wall biosynthesis
MRITIVTGPFLPAPPAPCGAVERLWFEMAREFVARGHKVVFVCRGHPTQRPAESIDGVRFIRRGRYHRTGKMHWDLLQDLLYSLQMLPELPEADVLITNVFWLPVFARHLRADAGKLVVNVQRYPKRQMILYGAAARISTVSRAIRDAIVAQFPRLKPRITVFPNPINTQAFRPPAMPRRYDARRVVAFTGRVHPEKGIHLLIEAFANLRDLLPPTLTRSLVLRIIGPAEVNQGGGGPEYLERLRRLADGLDVEFQPPIYDRQELAAALQQAHYYCYPSLAEKGESFGVAPLEAMGTGLVPVVSSLACFEDFIQDGRTGFFFDHRSPDAPLLLAKRLAMLIENPEMNRIMGESAAQTAGRFGNAQIACLYLDDFEKLIGRPRPGSKR